MESADVRIEELSSAPADLALLRRAYDSLFVPEFPDADERESVDNIERYLRLKDDGWYGPNNFHVVVLLDGDEPIGSSVSDYLAAVDSGVIEFLVVSPARRQTGLGRRLLDATERMLAGDAEARGRPLEAIVAELNDPFKDPGRDSLDPFLRLKMWDAWGYAKLDFPYVQPALSPEQRAVRHLLLAEKPLTGARDGPTSDRVKRLVHEYMRWAMRIEAPGRAAEFVEMVHYIDACSRIPLAPLGAYVGHDPGRPLAIREIRTADDPDFEPTLAVYETAFAPGSTTTDPASFRTSFATARHENQPYVYHLWALRALPEGAVSGMASFYTFPSAGFGGYLALGAGLKGTGRLPLVLARIEKQMVLDGTGARGWYIECAPHGVVTALFQRLGFREIAVDYVQPRLPTSGASADIPQTLLYKEFGAVYACPRVTVADFLDAIARIYASVYRITASRTHPLYQALRAQLDARGVDTIPFR